MAETSPIDVQRVLKGADYPAKKEDLVELAKKNHADQRIIDKIASSGAKQFDGPNDVQKAVFGKG
jgi:Protein of unknown function (DUF2795)